MTSYVPFLDEAYVQSRAHENLQEAYSNNTPIPVPIEDIIEKICKISLYYDEYQADILGWSDMQNNTIWINSQLLEEKNYHRMRFTMAHELGHCVLHGGYKKHLTPDKEGNQFYEKNYKRLERQANIFAASILMPHKELITEWERVTGSSKPHICTERDAKSVLENLDQRTEIIELMSDIFQVSRSSMTIELKKINLID